MKKIWSLALTMPFAINALANERPNILVIVCEDISNYLGCYGDIVAHSPNLDRFAEQSIRHLGMFTSVGVSSPSRYSLITGRYPSTDGANYMRVDLFDKEFEVVPPAGVRCYTELLRKAGYYCTNNAKTDYQFKAPVAAWDENSTKAHWLNAPASKPFLAIFNLFETHESKVWANADKPITVSPDSIVLPPYFPDCKEVRQDMAIMYSNIERMDKQFKKLLEELDASDRRDNTIVIFYSDNGGPMPRGKRELYDSGTLVPFMIRFPDKYGAGTANTNLNMFADIPATILALAGVDIPDYFHGRPMYGTDKIEKRTYVFGATDRFDEQMEKRASIRDERYLYVRNYMPDNSIYRPNEFRLQMPMMRSMERLRDEGRLDPIQMQWFEPRTEAELLFDCQKDPHNVNNLAKDKRYKGQLDKMRKAYEKEWIGPYNSQWVVFSEQDFKAKAYPDGVKPVCPTPQIEVKREWINVVNVDATLSISYRIGNDRWQLYQKPFPISTSGRVEILFERIGYIPSRIIVNI